MSVTRHGPTTSCARTNRLGNGVHRVAEGELVGLGKVSWRWIQRARHPAVTEATLSMTQGTPVVAIQLLPHVDGIHRFSRLVRGLLTGAQDNDQGQ